MAVRRNARLRREYLYRKSLEGKERQYYERKRRIREALQEGKAIPTELTAEADAIRDELALDDDAHDEQKTHMDDEYARAGEVEPKVLITTARDPSSRLKQFAKEMRLVFPNSERMRSFGNCMSTVGRCGSARKQAAEPSIAGSAHACSTLQNRERAPKATARSLLFLPSAREATTVGNPSSTATSISIASSKPSDRSRGCCVVAA